MGRERGIEGRRKGSYHNYHAGLWAGRAAPRREKPVGWSTSTSSGHSHLRSFYQQRPADQAPDHQECGPIHSPSLISAASQTVTGTNTHHASIMTRMTLSPHSARCFIEIGAPSPPPLHLGETYLILFYSFECDMQVLPSLCFYLCYTSALMPFSLFSACPTSSRFCSKDMSYGLGTGSVAHAWNPNNLRD